MCAIIRSGTDENVPESKEKEKKGEETDCN
jgi:hypothetical protein